MSVAIFDAYVAGRARELFAGDAALQRDRVHAVTSAQRRLDPAVHAALLRQNACFGASATRENHLAAMSRGAAAVVTGQQVGLFLGPLYTIYKAASAICAARAMSAESGVAVVPIFWLQTEDHDLAEIASCALPSDGLEPITLQLPAESDARISVEHVGLPETVRACHARLAAELSSLPFAGAHLSRLAQHYRPGVGFGSAFAGVLAELFEPEGLLLVNPRDPELAKLAAPVHRRALCSAEPIAQALIERDDVLRRADFSPAVHVRAGAPLSFFHPQGCAGPRYRLSPSVAGLHEVGGEATHTLEHVLQALEREPRSLSTSALLRPIVQDTLLPTAAYVGGPGELAYFAQLQPLYAAFGLQMPLFVPRARFTIVERRAARLLERWQLSARDVACTELSLLARLAASEPASDAQRASEDATTQTSSELEAHLSRELTRVIDTAMSALAPQSEPLSAPLRGPLERAHKAVQRTAHKLAQSYARARLHRDASRVHDAQRLQALLYPQGMPQERLFGFAYFAARYGERAFIEQVLSAIEPFELAPKELAL